MVGSIGSAGKKSGRCGESSGRQLLLASGSPLETRAGQACVPAVRAIAAAAAVAHVLVHITNRRSASLANGNRGFMAECAIACFRSGERHFAPALGLHNQTHGNSTFSSELHAAKQRWIVVVLVPICPSGIYRRQSCGKNERGESTLAHSSRCPPDHSSSQPGCRLPDLLPGLPDSGVETEPAILIARTADYDPRGELILQADHLALCLG